MEVINIVENIKNMINYLFAEMIFFLSIVKVNVDVCMLTSKKRENALFLFASINKNKRRELKMLID